MPTAFSAPLIFTGNTWLTDHALILNSGIIDSIIPSSQLPENIALKHFGECMIVPGFLDLQVYGAAGRLFASFPDEETLQVMRDTFLRHGTILFLPTLATNSLQVFKKGIDAIGKYKKNGGRGVYGIHLEGPWINSEKKGAHIIEWIRSPTLKEVKELLEYGEGIVKMITLAPEVCDKEIIEFIASKEIVISAGHSNATYDEAMNGFDSKISAVTHLYNAMSPLLHRKPGLVGAAFNHSQVMASIIPDGYHADYSAISIAKKIMGNRLFAITDAVTQTNDGPYQHQLSGDKYECNGVLSGSALSMHKAFKNLVDLAGIEIDEALRMCSLYPAKVLGCDNLYGKIAPHYAGQFLVLDKQSEIVQTITS